MIVDENEEPVDTAIISTIHPTRLGFLDREVGEFEYLFESEELEDRPWNEVLRVRRLCGKAADGFDAFVRYPKDLCRDWVSSVIADRVVSPKS